VGRVSPQNTGKDIPQGSGKRVSSRGSGLDLGEGAEQVHGVALLVGVGDELSVEVLVARQADALHRPVFFGEEAVVGVVDLLDVGEGGSAHTVQAVLVDAHEAVPIDVNCLKVVGNETLESRREFTVRFPAAILLNCLFELLNCNLAILRICYGPKVNLPASCLRAKGGQPHA